MTDDVVQDTPRKVRWFRGDHGLHAGWALLVFFLAVFVAGFVVLLAVTAAREALGVDVKAQGGVGFSYKALIIFDGSAFVALMLATGIMALTEKKSILAYGLTDKSFLPKFLIGIVSGLTAISALIGVLYLGHFITFDPKIPTGPEVIQNGLWWALAFLLVGLMEETFSRGYMQFTLARPLGPVWASLITSGIFLALHMGNAGENPIGLLNVALVGLVFCWSLYKTGSLFWAIGFHAAWDWGQTYFYGTADSGHPAVANFLTAHPAGIEWLSGGKAGPEGSVLVVPVLLVVAAGLWAWPVKVERSA